MAYSRQRPRNDQPKAFIQGARSTPRTVSSSPVTSQAAERGFYSRLLLIPYPHRHLLGTAQTSYPLASAWLSDSQGWVRNIFRSPTGNEYRHSKGVVAMATATSRKVSELVPPTHSTAEIQSAHGVKTGANDLTRTAAVGRRKTSAVRAGRHSSLAHVQVTFWK